MAYGIASANAMKMLWECDLIGGILSKAVDNVEALENMYLLPWETPHFAGWDIARTVLDEIINDAQDISDRLQDILGREETGKGHAVTDAELAMSQLERKVLATRLRVATRAQDFRNLLEEASGASQPAFTRYRHGAMDRDVASANAIMVTRECDLIKSIATEARESAVAWEEQRLAGWERARTVLDDVAIDATLLTNMLRNILQRENTGEGHAVTDIELAMAHNHRDILENKLEEASGAPQPAFKKYRRLASFLAKK